MEKRERNGNTHKLTTETEQKLFNALLYHHQRRHVHDVCLCTYFNWVWRKNARVSQRTDPRTSYLL